MEGPKLFEDTADEHVVDHFASSENIVPRFQASSVLSPLPPGLFPKSPWIKSSTASAEEFYYNFYYNEGLENKLTEAQLLGLAKSTY